MKEQGFKRNIVVRMLLIVACLVVMFSTDVQAAKLNKASLTLQKGKTYTLKVKGAKKKVTWKTKNSKVAKLINKKKSSVKIKAVKAGKTTITAKVSGKTYKCKITVVNPVTEKKELSDSEKNTQTETSVEETTDTASTTTVDTVVDTTPAKKKVWIITKQGKTEYTPVYVNERVEMECLACGYKTDDMEEGGLHQRNHLRNAEKNGYRTNRIWDDCYYVRTDYPEEGYWIEIDANEYPQGLKWRYDTSYPEGGYYYIDKSNE